MKTILLIDDESMPLLYYKIALRNSKRYKVLPNGDRNGVAFAFEQLRTKPELNAITVDIMMPTEGYFSAEETNDGMETGLILLNTIREVYPKLPIIILTNVANPMVLQKFAHSENIYVHQKTDLQPSGLVRLLDELI